MLTALIVEDDSIQRTAIVNVLSSAFPEIRFFTASNYITAVKLLQQETFLFFLLDIKLDNSEQDGIALGHYIRSQSCYVQTPILYLTSITDCIVEALNKIHCYSYLTKPYTPEELVSAVKELLNLHNFSHDEIKLQSSNGIYLKVKFSEIYYFETWRHQLTVKTVSGSYLIKGYSIKDLLNMLPDYFIQCHKSFIVNTMQIYSYNRAESIIKFDNSPEIFIPVGRVYKSALEERIGIK